MQAIQPVQAVSQAKRDDDDDDPEEKKERPRETTGQTTNRQKDQDKKEAQQQVHLKRAQQLQEVRNSSETTSTTLCREDGKQVYIHTRKQNSFHTVLYRQHYTEQRTSNTTTTGLTVEADAFLSV